MVNHLAEVVFRAGVFRALHFAPLWGAIGVALVAVAFLIARSRRY